jgi:hypothetical protein
MEEDYSSFEFYTDESEEESGFIVPMYTEQQFQAHQWEQQIPSYCNSDDSMQLSIKQQSYATDTCNECGLPLKTALAKSHALYHDYLKDPENIDVYFCMQHQLAYKKRSSYDSHIFKRHKTKVAFEQTPSNLNITNSSEVSSNEQSRCTGDQCNLSLKAGLIKSHNLYHRYLKDPQNNKNKNLYYCHEHQLAYKKKSSYFSHNFRHHKKDKKPPASCEKKILKLLACQHTNCQSIFFGSQKKNHEVWHSCQVDQEIKDKFPYQCDEHQLAYEKKGGYKDHKRKQHEKKQGYDIIKHALPNISILSLDPLNLSLDMESVIDAYSPLVLATRHHKKFSCCNIVFYNTEQKSYHQLWHSCQTDSAMKEKYPFVCDEHKLVFTEQEKLNAHLSSLHNPFKFCVPCNKSFHSFEKFLLHMKEHSSRQFSEQINLTDS